MMAPNGNPDFHVLVIGAGSVGLLIAQRLKTLGIKCTVFEREHYLNERPRDWSFAVSWTQGQLTECLPNALNSRLKTAFVNPLQIKNSGEAMRLLNGKTGAELKIVPTPNLDLYKRSKYRALLAEGIDVQFGKRLSTVSTSTHNGDATVTATFEDGSQAAGDLLIGTDGAKSVVRNYLLGPEIAALQPLPLVGMHATCTLPSEVAKKMAAEYHGQLTLIAYHPMGFAGHFQIITIPDHERPEEWTWILSMTIRQPESGSEALNTPQEIRKAWDPHAEQFAEPFRSAMLSLSRDTVIWSERLAQWPTVKWENSRGPVTLAGDAAHPMTYHRGQGLNNGVQDASTLCRALEEHVTNKTPLSDVMKAYEAELVERGREAVLLSTQNSLMITEWEQLMNAPIFKHGLKAPNGPPATA